MSRTIRIVVVLPAPLAPRNPKTSPGWTVKLSSSSAVTALGPEPKRLTSLSRTSVISTSG